MSRSKCDDDFHNYLVKGASIIGDPGIPVLMDLHNTQIPRDMIPFEKAKHATNKRQYVHFYMHDKGFSDVLTSTTKYLKLLKQFDGVITPDCSLLIGQSACLQQTNTYFNRAVGFYLQKNGIPVIPNIRWSDESSFDYCFLGVPKRSIVSISTYGCIDTKKEKLMFKRGLYALIKQLQPTDILVHGHMPNIIFCDFLGQVNFHRYKSRMERAFEKAV